MFTRGRRQGWRHTAEAAYGARMMVEPERALALSYAPMAARPALAALFALDETLGGIVRTTREPIVGQMRLTWWYEALVALDTAAPPAEPTLQTLHDVVLPHGASGRSLAGMTDGWEVLLEETLDAAAMDRFADARGGQLFAAAAMVLGCDDPRIRIAGQGWALADLAARLSDPAAAELACETARARLDAALRGRWPKRARALGALAHAAQFDVMPSSPPPAGPRRVGRMLIHRLTGR